MATRIHTASPTKKQLEIATWACKQTGNAFPDSILNLAGIIAGLQDGAFTLVVAYTQAGKTGLQKAFIVALPRVLMKKVGVVWITNKSSTTLEGQNGKALKELRLVDINGTHTNEKDLFIRQEMLSGGFWRRSEEGRIKHAHDILVAHGVDIVALVLDECHIAVKNGSQLSRLMVSLKQKCPQALTVTVGFTATPQVFLEGDIENTVPVNIIPIPPGEGYTGIDTLLETRIEHFDGYKDLGDFAHLVPKGKGIVLFRANNEAAIATIKDLALMRGALVDVFSSKKSHGHRPIAELLPALDAEPGRHTRYFVILAALSAGDDLKRDGKNLRRNIKAYFTDRFTSDHAAVQDVGRFTGYNVMDTCPIYVTARGREALESGMEVMKGIMNGDLPVKKFQKRKYPTLVPAGRLIPCTAEEYLKWLKECVLPIHPIAKPQGLTVEGRDKDKIFRNLLRHKIGTAAWARIDFTKQPTDPKDLQAYILLKSRNDIKTYAHFEFVVPKARRTSTVMNPLVQPV